VPAAQQATVSVREDEPGNVDLQGSDPDEDPLTFAIVTAPHLSYTPAPNFSGSDSLELSVNDGALSSTKALITIHVTPANDAPTATPQSVSVLEGTSLSITLAGSNIDGDALTFQVATA
jgi:hypothetical protein